MLHLSCIFEWTTSATQSTQNEIEPPEITTPIRLANPTVFMENAKAVGIFNAANRMYSSNNNAVNHKTV